MTDMLRPRRLIRLEDVREPCAHPYPEAPPTHVFESFPLPYFPVSQSAWLTCLCDLFYARQQRMIALFLILNIRQQEWTRPLPPTQRCGSDGVSFRLKEEDLAILPDSCRVAGSFQLAHASVLSDAILLIPPFDGLHRVYSIDARQSKHCFLRISGELHHVLPESVLIDDWRLYLQQYRDRLTLG
jgi:hypothetical protein